MAEFMGDFVVLLALATLGAGLWHLDLIKRDSHGTAAKFGAWVLILAGAGTALCAASYMLSYRSGGDFERAYPPALMVGHDMGMMKKMTACMDGSKAAESEDEHAHP